MLPLIFFLKMAIVLFSLELPSPVSGIGIGSVEVGLAGSFPLRPVLTACFQIPGQEGNSLVRTALFLSESVKAES